MCLVISSLVVYGNVNYTLKPTCNIITRDSSVTPSHPSNYTTLSSKNQKNFSEIDEIETPQVDG